jgi:hypothetical protein
VPPGVFFSAAPPRGKFFRLASYGDVAGQFAMRLAARSENLIFSAILERAPDVLVFGKTFKEF